MGNSTAFGVVVHSTSKEHAALALDLARILRSNGYPAYILSVGRLTSMKLGNFPDLKAFVIIGCMKSVFARADFSMPLLLPFEVLCFLQALDFWTDPYELDHYKLHSKVLQIQAMPVTESLSKDLAINSDFSMMAFERQNYKGVPENGSLEGASLTIQPGETGLPRSYTSMKLE